MSTARNVTRTISFWCTSTRAGVNLKSAATTAHSRICSPSARSARHGEECQRRDCRDRTALPAWHSPWHPSETDADLELHGPRRHEVRAAERRQEVVERVLVRQVDHGEPGADLRPARVEQVVHTDPEVEQVARRDAGRIVDVVFGAFGGNLRAASRRRRTSQLVIGFSRVATVLPQKNPMAACWSPLSARASSMLPTDPATRPESYRQLSAAHAPSGLANVYWKFAVELNFWSWSMRKSPSASSRRMPPTAGRREDRVGVRHHDERAEALVLDDVDAAGEAVELRVIPRDREGDRRIEQDAEVDRRSSCA